MDWKIGDKFEYMGETFKIDMFFNRPDGKLDGCSATNLNRTGQYLTFLTHHFKDFQRINSVIIRERLGVK